MTTQPKTIRVVRHREPGDSRLDPMNDDELRDNGIDPRELAPPGKPWPELADLALKLGSQGPRLPFGIKPIDSAWRGGAPAGTFLVVQAPPGTGKTTLALMLCHRWATLEENPVPCLFVAADEGREGLLVRLGQMHGCDRESLENGLESAKGTLAEHLRGRPLYVLDTDEDEGVDLGPVARELRRRYPEGLTVLVVDSIQAVAATMDPAVGIRERVDQVVRTLKAIAKTQRMIVIALSEVGRGAYRKDDELVSDLSASKESSGIEYGAGAVAMLRNRKNANGVVDVTFPKARLGRIEPFVMKQDFRYATFNVDTSSAPPPAEEDPSASFDSLRAAVEACVAANPGTGGAEPISKRIVRNTANVRAALKDLVASGRVIPHGTGNRARYTLRGVDLPKVDPSGEAQTP